MNFRRNKYRRVLTKCLEIIELLLLANVSLSSNIQHRITQKNYSKLFIHNRATLYMSLAASSYRTKFVLFL